jgi:hypothetical protein
LAKHQAPRAATDLASLYRVPTQRENGLVRVVVTWIGQDGTMLRRMVDTCRRVDGRQWEHLAARALEFPPPYRPVPGAPIYSVSLDDGTAVLVAEHDLCGPLLHLVTAVLALGGEACPPATRPTGLGPRGARLVEDAHDGGRGEVTDLLDAGDGQAGAGGLAHGCRPSSAAASPRLRPVNAPYGVTLPSCRPSVATRPSRSGDGAVG